MRKTEQTPLLFPARNRNAGGRRLGGRARRSFMWKGHASSSVSVMLLCKHQTQTIQTRDVYRHMRARPSHTHDTYAHVYAQLVLAGLYALFPSALFCPRWSQ